jgi:hypothetical protein
MPPDRKSITSRPAMMAPGPTMVCLRCGFPVAGNQFFMRAETANGENAVVHVNCPVAASVGSVPPRRGLRIEVEPKHRVKVGPIR